MKILKGRVICQGTAEGLALVMHEAIHFGRRGVDPETGIITETRHELTGECISEKVLVTPSLKGTASGMWTIYRLAKAGKAPKAIISRKADAILTAGAILGQIPCIDQLDQDPITQITTGDYVEVDAEKGTVTIRTKKE